MSISLPLSASLFWMASASSRTPESPVETLTVGAEMGAPAWYLISVSFFRSIQRMTRCRYGMFCRSSMTSMKRKATGCQSPLGWGRMMSPLAPSAWRTTML